MMNYLTFYWYFIVITPIYVVVFIGISTAVFLPRVFFGSQD